LGASRPATRLRIVLLPQPEGPTTATNSPLRTLKLTRSIAVSVDRPPGAAKRLVTPMRSSTDAVFCISGIQRSVDLRQFLLQCRRAPRSRCAGGPLDAVASERARHLLKVRFSRAEDPFQRRRERFFFRRQRT